jgi:putative chitinase
MKLHELFNDNTIDEDLQRRAGLIGLGSALLSPSAALGSIRVAGTPHRSSQSAECKDCTAKNVNTNRENYLTRYAQSEGIDGIELAAFLAQMAHESQGFKKMEENGSPRYFLKYDIKGNPAKADELGNTKHGDGAKYKGRGFIHLTGKANYKKISDALGINIVSHPELAADVKVAAKIATYFWKNKVQPYVSHWDDVKHVTKQINPGLEGINDRKENYAHYKSVIRL